MDWLFQLSHSACNGLSSNFGAVAAILELGCATTTLWRHNYDPEVYKSIDRRRDLLRTFWLLSEADQNVLWAAYGPHQYPRSVSAVLPAIEGPALALMDAETLLRLCNKVSTGSATAQDRGKISDLRMRSEQALDRALQAFAEKHAATPKRRPYRPKTRQETL